jgi:hypothetical protein
VVVALDAGRDANTAAVVVVAAAAVAIATRV